MMNTVAPVWDGNETWLVLGGAALFGAFPLAYSVVLSALYLPLMLMLIGLIFRGVAFEFRFKAKDHKRHLWDKAFIGGSLAATFFQGVALGAFIDGIPVVDRQFAGGSLDWLTPFTLFCGVALVVAYALLGCTWLIMKTEGAAGADARPGAAIGLCGAGGDRHRQPVDAAGAPGNRRALVQPAEPVLVPAGADPGAGDHVRADPRGGTQCALHAVPADPGADLPRLQRPGHQPVAEHHPAVDLDLGRRRAAAKPGLHAGGHAVHHSVHPGYTFWSYYVFRGKVTHEDGYH
jgi:cytochrome d ubiquinol oxidase subunit II